MGQTYAQSIIRSHVTDRSNMMILEKNVEKAAQLEEKNIGTVFSDPKECIEQADLIILAVKPQDTDLLFNRYDHILSRSKYICLSWLALR
jgi:Pyrroline-5-carboxylate reductase